MDKEALNHELEEIDVWFRSHEYIGTKIATGRGTVEEYADIIAEMNVNAERKNEIKRLLEE